MWLKITASEYLARNFQVSLGCNSVSRKLYNCRSALQIWAICLLCAGTCQSVLGASANVEVVKQTTFKLEDQKLKNAKLLSRWLTVHWVFTKSFADLWQGWWLQFPSAAWRHPCFSLSLTNIHQAPHSTLCLN